MTPCNSPPEEGREAIPLTVGSAQTKTRRVPASFFDVDGTLVRTNLLHPTLFYLANQPNPFRSLSALARAAAGGPRMALAEMVDRRRFNELLFAVYKGISHDRLLLLADEAFDAVVRRGIYPGARDLVQRSLAKGHEVVLVSGALDFLMERLAKHLGATAHISNRLEIKDGYATGRLLRPIVAGPEKARLLREWAKERDVDLGACFAYSDSYSDVPMLSVVGHPCAVNPDMRLFKLARTYAWPVVRWDEGTRSAVRDLWERLP
jgi:HAD superfamily hydrolase (TIGR01490 family)